MISAILLAAGQSKRMNGENKLTKKINGVPLINLSILNILESSIEELIIVTGYQNEILESIINKDNKIKIKNVRAPVLIMHGEADQIVPFSMGKKIYEIANEPKYSYFTKHDNHMMEYDENLLKALNSFFKSLN